MTNNVGRAAEIIAMVDQKELDSSRLHERMDEDYGLWRLDSFSHDQLTGYQKYTSNDPRTLGRKGVSLLSGASMTVRVLQGNDDRGDREQDNRKEQFIRGNFRANDERLVMAGGIPLRSFISWCVMVRGYTTGRCLLNKRDNRAWADATPWDPREVTWEFGHDGLMWICHKTVICPAAIRSEYRKDFEGNDSDGIVKYDYYDRERNIVIIPAIQEAPVKNERHGMVDGFGEPRVPGWVVASSAQPMITTRPEGSHTTDVSALTDAWTDYGESIYADNRQLYADDNFVMSIRKELAYRSLKPVFGIRSRDGVKLVEGDPFQAGAEIPLAEGEELIVYPFQTSAPDINPMQSVISAEKQRGGFSSITFGDTPFAISGFAMQTLKAGDTADKVEPFLHSEQTALKMIANAWCDHFQTRAFPPIQISGQGSNRRWFSANITPEDLMDLDEPIIQLTPILREDDAAKAQLAQLYRQPGPDGLPLRSLHSVLENVLQVEDSDMEVDMMFQEIGRTAHPLAQLHTLVEALSKRNAPRAQYYFAQWQQLLMASMQQGFSPFAMQQGGGSSPQGNGLSPETMPNAAQGAPPPGVVPQGGPNVPPGTPRPGAQNGAGPGIPGM